MSDAVFEAKAREILDQIDGQFGLVDEAGKIIVTALREATLAEREACAKVADNALGYGGVPCKQAAALIRKRSATDD